jgi:3-dehydroquinate dehydratase II
MTKLTVINGPNLNLLGSRQPAVYGTMTLADLEEKILHWAESLEVKVNLFQSNHEGDLIEAIHRSRGLDGIVINPGAFTHTSRAIADAVLSVEVPTVEVHVTNVKDREPWRAHSVLGGVVSRTIYGRGFTGYRDAIRHLVNRAKQPFEVIRYGPHPDNVGDLRGDLGISALVAILVHGGFWAREWERDTMETLAVDLAGRGQANWNIEYRRLGDGGGWPGSAHDVKMAIDHMRLATEKPIVVIGHSAGGLLAIWAAGKTEVSRVIGLAAITDLTALASADGPGREPADRLLVDGAPQRLETVPKGTVLIHGAEDDLVDPDHSQRLDGTGDVTVFDRLGHFQLLDPRNDHWPVVLAALGAAGTL